MEVGTRVEARATEVGTRVEARVMEVVTRVEARVMEVGTRVEARATEVGTRVEARATEVGTRVEARVMEVGTRVEARVMEVGTRVEARVMEVGTGAASRAALKEGTWAVEPGMVVETMVEAMAVTVGVTVVRVEMLEGMKSSRMSATICQSTPHLEQRKRLGLLVYKSQPHCILSLRSNLNGICKPDLQAGYRF